MVAGGGVCGCWWGACMVAGRGAGMHSCWWGASMVAGRGAGMHSCWWGASMVAGRGCAWLLVGGMWLLAGGCMVVGGMHDKGGHGCWQGACMAKGGLHGKGAWQMGGCVWQKGDMCGKRGHVWDTTTYRDTINERVVCILLECILVLN